MNVKQRLFISKKKKQFIKKWYEFVKPLDNYLIKRDDIKYQKTKDKITEEQAINWFSRSIIDYMIRKSNPSIKIIIATYINTDYHSGSFCIADLLFERLLKKKKYKMAFYKFNKGLDFQEKVIDILRKDNNIEVKEEIEEFISYVPDNYQKTYFISVKK